MKKYLSITTILLSLLFLGLSALRFVYLDALPAGLAHDEVIYSINRQTLIRNGTDSGGVGLPLAFLMTKTEGNISILPVLLAVPLQFFLQTDQFTARLPYAIINILTAVALYFFTYFLLRNKIIAILAAGLFLLNPWSFFLSRFATESPYALLFFLLGLASLLKFRGKYLIIPFVFFATVFFSYHGAKIVLLPAVIIALIFLSKGTANHKLSKKEIITFTASIVALYLLFFVGNFIIPDSIVAKRKEELFFLDSESIAKAVDTQRALAIDNTFASMIVNKYTVMLRIFWERYIHAFSSSVLFLSGDTRLVYTFGNHGLFYIFDAILMLIGFVFLWLKEQRKALFISCLIVIAPLASALSGVEFSYVHRSFLLLPLFIILAAVGLYTLYRIISKKVPVVVAIGVLGCFVLFPAANFFHFYFYRYPITNGEYYSIDERVLAKFIKESQQFRKPIINVVDNPGDVYFTSAYYANDDGVYRSVINNIEGFHNNSYIFQNNTFRSDCPPFTKDTIFVTQWSKICTFPGNPVYVIRNPKDGGIFYKIYNSNLCDGFALSPWRRNHRVSDYAIEKMDRKTFCERWIAVQ